MTVTMRGASSSNVVKVIPWICSIVLAVLCSACLGAERASASGENGQSASNAPSQSQKTPPPDPQAPGDSLKSGAEFPLPIWRNRHFDDVNELAGVLLRTTEGTLQIERIQWATDENGLVYCTVLNAFTEGGARVEFGQVVPGSPPLTKQDFLGVAMTGSSSFALQSFDLATDAEGFLFLANPVVVEMPAKADEPCGIKPIRNCRSEGCTGECGFPVAELQLMPLKKELGVAFEAPILQDPQVLECKCSGASGKCKVREIRECQGTCLNGMECKFLVDGTCDCKD
jgi:hypothetical protein